MCGITGYIGRREVPVTLLEGLKRLEYRGYDSAGLALLNNSEIIAIKNIGKVANLEKKTAEQVGLNLKNGIGIAHTRWATHGYPSVANAHPHLDGGRRFAIVHNGIIENYQVLKKHLEEQGVHFESETDSEVLSHLIARHYRGSLFDAVADALKKVKGTYALAVISKDHPDTMIVARCGSPLLIGVGDHEMFIASDAAAIAGFTRQVIYLNDHDLALVTAVKADIRSLDNAAVSRDISNIDWEPEAAEKGGFDHFMLKEICEQPEALANAIRGRLDVRAANTRLNGLNLSPYELARIQRIVIAACGTSMHAGMVGRYYFEDLAALPVDVEQAAEFRYRNPIIHPETLVIPISQSGETADTLAAVREAANKGAIVTAVCNVVGSTIARESGRCIYLHAGPEIGVASTKAFTCQVSVLLMLAIHLGRNRRLSCQAALELIAEIENIPRLVAEVLESREHIAAIARKYAQAENFFYIGRGYLYPAALEGALKLKEISYIHAEGYHAAELKHGPIALLEERVPVLALANDLPGKDKMLGNIQECRARRSPVIATVTDGDADVSGMVDDVIRIPRCSQYVAPILTVAALQLFAYYIARERGCEIDQPRNLAKSVTVE
jgi:glucosamine--fructose-6-phosphate aminotransferase (isomerizing)